MSQLSRVAKQLRKNTEGAGIAVDKLAKLSGVPKDSVYKRVHDLRVNEGKTIYSNYRTVKGRKTLFYRFAV